MPLTEHRAPSALVPGRQWTAAGTLALLAIACSAPIGAQPIASSGEDACANATTTVAMRDCASVRYRRAQSDLDAVFASLLHRADALHRQKLQRAQAAWRTFRDSQADLVADGSRGGTLAPLLRLTALAELTEKRVTELRTQLESQ